MISISKLTIHVLTCLALAAASYNATAATPTPLPPAAEEALNKGIIAAKVPDYLLAIRYFEEARKLASQAPVVYLNLGLAESRIPGRELRAMAWFGAYLAAYPDAPNAAAVKEQIGVLEVRNQSNTSRFLKTVQGAADLVSGDYHAENLLQVVKLWVDAGDMTAALKAANLIQGERNRDAYYRSMAQSRIVHAQAESGDIAGAQKTADLIQFSISKSEALIPIAEAKMKAGDSSGARMTFASALKSADLIDTEPSFGGIASATYKSRMQVGVAIAQAKSGDIADAQKTVGLITEAHKGFAGYAQIVIAEAQASSGEIDGALKTAQLILDASLKSKAMSAIAAAQAKTGAANGQRPTGQSMPATQRPPHPVLAVSDWLKKLDDDNKSSDCPLNTEPFLDLAGYLKSLPSADAQKIFNGMFDAAGKIVKAQNVITGMLKQQATR